MHSNRSVLLAVAGVLLVAVGVGLVGSRGTQASSEDRANAQLARLYQLQASFHGATTVREGHPDSIEARVADVVALWADDGTLTMGENEFVGPGVHGAESCEPGSMTVCDFFANVAPTFFPDNAWVSLSPAFATEIEVDGNTARLAFECHFFDRSDWSPQVKIGVEATAVKIGDEWLFSTFIATPIALPHVPYP